MNDGKTRIDEQERLGARVTVAQISWGAVGEMVVAEGCDVVEVPGVAAGTEEETGGCVMDWREQVTWRKRPGRRLRVELRVLYNRTIGRASLAVGRFFRPPVRMEDIPKLVREARREWMEWQRTKKGDAG